MRNKAALELDSMLPRNICIFGRKISHNSLDINRQPYFRHVCIIRMINKTRLGARLPRKQKKNYMAARLTMENCSSLHMKIIRRKYCPHV